MQMRTAILSTSLVAMVALGGCGATEPARLFLLAPVAAPPTNAAASGAGPALAIGPIDLPKHLDRPQIATFASVNRLDVAEFDRWAEPLADNFARVLAENLGILVPTNRAYVQPVRRSMPVDYQVSVDVTRFGVMPDRSVQLVALWSVISADGRGRSVSQGFQHVEPVVGDGYEPMVAAMSKAVAALSRTIAATIQSLPRR
jgi:uncharacterized lipoprotein YmbA